MNRRTHQGLWTVGRPALSALSSLTIVTTLTLTGCAQTTTVEGQAPGAAPTAVSTATGTVASTATSTTASTAATSAASTATATTAAAASPAAAAGSGSTGLGAVDPAKVAAVNAGTMKQAGGVKMTKPAKVDPEAVVDELSMTGGCVPGYGEGTACLPSMSPRLASQHVRHSGMAALEMAQFWTCPEVRDLIPKGITVNKTGPKSTFPGSKPGKDPLRLDKNNNGIACDPADA